VEELSDMAFDKELHVLFVTYSQQALASGNRLSDVRWELMRLAGFLQHVQLQQLDWKKVFADKEQRTRQLFEYGQKLALQGKSQRRVEGMLSVAEGFFVFSGFTADAQQDTGADSESSPVLSEEEQNLLLNACIAPQEKALVAMLMIAGLKIGECTKLNIADIACEKIALRRRNNVVVWLELPSSCLPAITECLSMRTEQTKDPLEAFFVGLSGNRFSQSSIQYHLKTIGYRAGRLHVNAQLLRDTYLSLKADIRRKERECAA
jgi:site-specific recombinase XerC